MANIRISDMVTTSVDRSDTLIINSTDGRTKRINVDLVRANRASDAEAIAAVDNTKSITPLTAYRALAGYGLLSDDTQYSIKQVAAISDAILVQDAAGVIYRFLLANLSQATITTNLAVTLASTAVLSSGIVSWVPRTASLTRSFAGAVVSSSGTVSTGTSTVASFTKPLPLVQVTGILTAASPPGANDLYVSTAGNASDSNPGTQASPFRTIQRAANLVNPGHVVHVAPGTYNERISISRSGTSSQRIRFVSDQKWGALIRPTGAGGSGWGASNAFDVGGNYITIEGFDITPASGAQMNCGIYFNSPTGGKAINNKLYRIAVVGMSDGPGAIVAESGCNQTDMIANWIYNIGKDQLEHGIYIADGTGNIINNVCGNCAGFGIHLWHTPHDVNIINNTVFNCGEGGITVGAGEASGANASNCIVANNHTYQNTTRLGINTAGTFSNGLYVNNFWSDGHTVSSGSGNVLTGNFQSGTVAFVNYLPDGTGNYRLASNSAAINRGSATYAPATDADGNSRSGTPDCGAFEFVG